MQRRPCRTLKGRCLPLQPAKSFRSAVPAALIGPGKTKLGARRLGSTQVFTETAVPPVPTPGDTRRCLIKRPPPKLMLR